MSRQSQPKKQIPKPPSPGPGLKSSLHSNTEKPLSSAVISYAGLSTKEKEVLNKKIYQMGGQVNNELDENVTHLLASDAGQDEYKAALRLRIPVLEPGWISDIYEQWAKGVSVDIKEAAEKFVMGPLSGCGICVTGLLTETRMEIEQDTILLGGRYSHDLLRYKTTHLICGHPSGPKYESALQWGVKCLPIQWFKDTLATLELADPSKYTLIAYNNGRTKDSGATRISNRSADAAKEPAPTREKMYLEACHIFLCPSFSAAQVSTIKKMIRMAGGLHVVEYDPMEVTHVLVPSDRLEPSTLKLFNQDSHLPYIVNHQWLSLSNKKGMVMPEADFTVPLSMQTEDDLLNQQPERPSTLNVNPAHGTNKDATSRSQTASVRSKTPASSATGPPVSTMARNHEAEQSQSSAISDRTPASMSSSVSPQSNRFGLRARTVSGFLNGPMDDLTINSMTLDGLPTQDGSLISRTDMMHISEEMDMPQSNIFLGLYITSYGCKASVSKTIREQTAACGGTFFEDLKALPSGTDARIIVPLSTPLDSVKDLKGMVLTSCWFECSLLEERVVSRNEHFLFKPMKSIPIKGFEELCISVSSINMKEFEYRQIGRAIKILGATFLDKLHSAQTNLLISDYASGPKYEFMADKNLPIVRMDWLRQCIEQGERLPFKEYLLISYASVKDESTGSSSSSWRQPSSHHSSELSGSTITSQTNHSQQAVRSDTPLDGLTICMFNRVDGDYKEMQRMIIQMGGRQISAYSSVATHLIHKGKATPEVKRVVRAAKKDGLSVVSPDWLYRCAETGIRVNEREFPETYDDKHLTLNMTHSQAPKDLTARIQPPRPSQSLSPGPPGRAGARTLSPSANFGWSATAGTQHYHDSTGNTGPSQSFQGTASGGVSTLYGGDIVPSSMNMSANNSMETSLAGILEMTSQRQDKGTHSDMDRGWQPVPMVTMGRKRRRAQTAPESASSDQTKDALKSGQTTEDGQSVPENDDDKSTEKYDEDGVYWVDVEGQARKRALLESLGLRTSKPLSPGPNPPDHRLQAIAQDLESQRSSKYQFLLTGLNIAERNAIKKTIQELGGVILEDINGDHDDWQKKCTHLITNGSNPPRTAKLVIAKACKAIIVTKGFMFASAEKGAFVDETPYRVHV